jgi:hypothetical protein
MAKKTKTQTVRKTSKTTGKRRLVKYSNYKSFRLQKRIKRLKKKTPSSFKVFAETTKHLSAHKRVYIKLTLLATFLNLLLVKGFTGGTDVDELKILFDELVGNAGQITQSLGIFSVLLSNTTSAQTDSGSLYQVFLIIILSLAYIWTVRRLYGKKRIKLSLRESFYKSTHPLIAFLGVLFVIGAQMIPITVGAFLYATVIEGGLAVNNLEVFLWLLMIFLLVLLSFYWLTASVFAMYIVTLPDTRPISAIKSAGDLVRFRRWELMRKVLFLPFALLLIMAVIMLPIISFLPVIAEWTVYILSMLGVLFAHLYLYHLYRKLL